MPKSLVIAGKDLRQRLRDRSALVLAFIAPFVLAAILGTLLPEDEDDVSTVHRYAVADEDGGEVAATFVDEVLPEFDRDPGTEILNVSSAGEARRTVRSGNIAAAFIIPEGFSDAVASGGSTEIEVVGNTESRIATQIADAVASAFVGELNAVRLSAATAAASGGEPPDAEQVLGAVETETPIRVETDSAQRKEFGANTFFAAGMAVFFLFFTAQFGVLSLLTERREGTLARLVAAPISPRTIITGKALSTFVLGLISMTVLIVASTFLLGAEWGDPIGVIVLVLGAVLSAMGLTSLIASLARTDEQAAGYTSIVAVTLGILGGTFFPVSQGPGLLATLNLFTPHYWIMRGFGDLSSGSDASAVLVPFAALVAFGAVVGAVAMLRAQRMVTEP